MGASTSSSKLSAGPPSGPVILWPRKTRKCKVNDRSDKYTQTLIGVPPAEYWLRDSLKKLTMYKLSVQLVEDIMKDNPAGAHPIWRPKLAKLPAELRQELFEFMGQWVWRHWDRMPLPSWKPQEKRPGEYLDEKTRERWGNIRERVINQLLPLEKIIMDDLRLTKDSPGALGHGCAVVRYTHFTPYAVVILPEAFSEASTIAVGRLWPRDSSIYAMVNETTELLKPIKNCFEAIITSNVTKLDLRAFYDQEEANVCREVFRKLAAGLPALTTLKLGGWHLTNDDLLEFAMINRSPLEDLLLNIAIGAGAGCEEGLVAIAKAKKKTMRVLSLVSIHIADGPKFAKMFRYLKRLVTLQLGAHDFTANPKAREPYYQVDGQLPPDEQRANDEFRLKVATTRCVAITAVLNSIATYCKELSDFQWSSAGAHKADNEALTRLQEAVASVMTNCTELKRVHLALPTSGDWFVEMASTVPKLDSLLVDYNSKETTEKAWKTLASRKVFANLSVLKMVAAMTLKDEHLIAMAKYLAPHLTNVDFSYSDTLTDEGIIPFVKAASGSLEDLRADALRHVTDASISEAVVHCTKLTRLGFGGPKLTHNGVIHLTVLTDLQELGLADARGVGGKVLWKLCLALRKLESIRIPGHGKPLDEPWQEYEYAVKSLRHLFVSVTITY